MGFFKRTSPLEKEYLSLMKDERKFMLKRQEEKVGFLNKTLEGKVPEKLRSTLDAAFCKAFELIFKKGVGAIELTYKKENLQKEFKLRQAVMDIKGTRRSVKAFNKTAKAEDNFHLLLSGVSGVSMGILGIGIPDIPVFTAMMLRDIYKTAVSFGFKYDSWEERFFILKCIEASVSKGSSLSSIDTELNSFIERGFIPDTYTEEKQIERTSKALSSALLYMKFLQGIPIAGAVGGIYDAVYMKEIASYSTLKYRKRFLTCKFKEEKRS